VAQLRCFHFIFGMTALGELKLLYRRIDRDHHEETKEVKNILIRRGNEWHAPDRMVLNARHIILIEPVGPNSKVAELIAQDKTQVRKPD